MQCGIAWNCGVPHRCVAPPSHSFGVPPRKDALSVLHLNHETDDTPLFIIISPWIPRSQLPNLNPMSPTSTISFHIVVSASNRQSLTLFCLALTTESVLYQPFRRSILRALLSVSLKQLLHWVLHLTKPSICTVILTHFANKLIITSAPCTTSDRNCRIISACLGTASVHSRLDYCNSILYGTSTLNLNKLHVVENRLARTANRYPLSVSEYHISSTQH